MHVVSNCQYNLEKMSPFEQVALVPSRASMSAGAPSTAQSVELSAASAISPVTPPATDSAFRGVADPAATTSEAKGEAPSSCLSWLCGLMGCRQRADRERAYILTRSTDPVTLTVATQKEERAVERE